MDDVTPFATDDASAVRLETGRRIRFRRQQLNISVADLAAGLGVSRESVYGYESGSRAINSYDLPRLGQLLRVPISFLFGEFILYGPETERVGTWVRPDQYPSVGRFPDEQTSIILSEAEIEVIGIMRGLSQTGQNYVQAFTKMVQEQESGSERKTEDVPGTADGGHHFQEPGDSAQKE